jgi:outer membrane lipoprotein-sorting protein
MFHRPYPILLVWLVTQCSVARGGQSAPKSPAGLLARMQAAASTLEDYQVMGAGTENGKKSEFKLYYKRPNLVRVDSHDGQVAVQPNGEIRGRMGKGLFGKLSQQLGRHDKRLNDDEGIPFYETHYLAMISRIKSQAEHGATLKTGVKQGQYILNVQSRQTVWKYVIDSTSLYLIENSRSVRGKQVDYTRYSSFHPNTGIKAELFKF